MIISKRELLRDTSKLLGKEFTIDKMKSVYEALHKTIEVYLMQVDYDEDITVKLGSGLSLTSTIRMMDDNPRLWLKARVSRYHNRVKVNEFKT